MHITTDTVGCTNLFYFLDGFNLVIEHFSVYGIQLSFLEFQFQLFAACFRYLLQVSTFRQSLCGIQNLTTTDRRAPDAYVV